MASTAAVAPEVAPLAIPSTKSRHQSVYEANEEQDRALQQFIQEQQQKLQQERERERRMLEEGREFQHHHPQHVAHQLKPPPVPPSRFRNLRGKSVSSITRRGAFDAYGDSGSLPPGDCYPQLDSPTLSSRTSRRRSKSVASLPCQVPSPPNDPPPPAPSLPSPPESFRTARTPSPGPGLAEGDGEGDVNANASAEDELAGHSSAGGEGADAADAAITCVAGADADADANAAGVGSNANAEPNPDTAPLEQDQDQDQDADPGAAAVPTRGRRLGPLNNLIGGLAPRAAVGAVGSSSPVRTASPSPASITRHKAPSPVPPLPSPLCLTPKPSNVPSSAASSLRNPSRSRTRTRSPSTESGLLKLVKAKSKSKSKSRSKSKTKSAKSKSPAPPTPLPDTSPADALARLKAFNFFSLRTNADTAARVAQLDREDRVRTATEEDAEAERWAAEVARLEAETDRILAEQKKRDAARFRAQFATPPPKFSKYLLFDKIPFLSRGRRSNAATSQTGTPSPKAPTLFSIDFSRHSSFEDPNFSDKMSFIEAGGRGIVPNVDAPTSAINGGERRVTVRCQSSTINLPVKADTSPVDLLYSTANLTSHNIDPKTSVLIECYVELGLERRLRRYERIRDIMNSWDRDQQNSLLVLTIDLSESDSDADLDLNSVPRTPSPPSGFTLHLYHSSRPGKWNKRWITLLETGQIFAAKKAEAKVSDKDSVVLCHLSDFDIYTPRESEARKHLKAPRRFCYAVKSQQKTFVFPNGENFVHFFCAEDPQLAKRFFQLVQGWRSWYLVTKHIDFEKTDKPYERIVNDKPPRISQSSCPSKKGGAIPKSTSTVTNGSHRLKVSVDENPYTIGAFQPLLDLDQFNKPLEDFGKDFEPVPAHKPEPKPEPKIKQEKPKVLTKKGPSTPQMPQSAGAFSPGGLLGNGYEEKRRIAEQIERKTSNGSGRINQGPFTEGPSLLNGGVGSPTSPQEKKIDVRPWLPSASEHSARSRSKSVRSTRRNPVPDTHVPPNPKMPQPLVNLTNFPEPPSWRENVQASQGHGHKAPVSKGPLINFATGGQPMQNIGPGLLRSATRAGTSNKSTPPLASSATLPSLSNSQGGRPRSRSTAGMQQPPHQQGGRGPAPPVPPLPIRSMRREQTQPLDQPRGRDPRPREPLISRAGTNGAMARY